MYAIRKLIGGLGKLLLYGSSLWGLLIFLFGGRTRGTDVAIAVMFLAGLFLGIAEPSYHEEVERRKRNSEDR